MAESPIEMIYKVIKDAGNGITAKEIAERIAKNYPEYAKEREGRDTKNHFIEMIPTEISNYYLQKKLDKKILRTDDRPQKYYLSELDLDKESQDENSTVLNINIATTKNNFDEAQLYNPLVKYFRETDNIYAMRIDEKTSKNNNGEGGNKWLHPDIVGISDIFSNKIKDDKIKDLAKNVVGNSFKFYSYEVKPKINSRGEAREYFFQTLSNSSWANYSYLVCTELKTPAEEELKMLCKSFGVGLLIVPFDSNNEILENECKEVVAPREKNVDMILLNRLAENNHFKKFIDNVYKCYKTGNINDF